MNSVLATAKLSLGGLWDSISAASLLVWSSERDPGPSSGPQSVEHQDSQWCLGERDWSSVRCRVFTGRSNTLLVKRDLGSSLDSWPRVIGEGWVTQEVSA